MPQSTCACSSSSSVAANEVIPGLMEADLSTINLTQGLDYSWKQCFVRDLKPIQILEERTGGKIILNKADHCFKVDDKIRLINYDHCTPDVAPGAIVTISAIDPNPANPAQNIVTTDLVTIDKTYTAAAVSTAIKPMGCAVGAVADAASLPPYVMGVCSAKDLLLSGGIFGRDDYYQYFAVSAASGSNTLYTTVLGMVQPGDAIVSTQLGLATPAKVLRVDSETVQSGTSTIKREKITIDRPTNQASECAEVQVTRGLSVAVEFTADGDCWEITIPGSATANLQLSPKMRKGDGYGLGTLTIFGTYGVLVDGKLRSRQVELYRATVNLKPSHAGVM